MTAKARPPRRRMVPAPHLGVCLKLHTQYGGLKNRFSTVNANTYEVALSSGASTRSRTEMDPL